MGHLDDDNAAPPRPPLSPSFNQLRLLAFYVLFGALHELAHLIAALLVGILDVDGLVSASSSSYASWSVVLMKALLFRRCEIPLLLLPDSDNEGPLVAIVRHAGWTTSVVLALLVWCFCRSRPRQRGNDNFRCRRRVLDDHNDNNIASMASMVAWIVALEAIWTDLLGMYSQGLPLYPLRPGDSNATHRVVVTFLCGNFGLILLNPKWTDSSSGRSAALDVLEKMVSVTMMRGAQSGGVVTFLRRSRRCPDQLIGIRSRVVNAKRTDLSKRVRRKIESDAFRCRAASGCGGPYDDPGEGGLVKYYAGHTRFATSSIASFDGTHPHQWSPPRLYRTYRFDVDEDLVVVGGESRKKERAEPVLVENFITHNGDLDFYQLNGVSYGLDVVQKYLELCTGYPMPSAVDSAAIAGLVDLLHTRGCFALSVRYAVCLGLHTANMSGALNRVMTPDIGGGGVGDDGAEGEGAWDDDDESSDEGEEPAGAFPTIRDFTRVAAFFERALDRLLEKTGNGLDYICSMPEERQFLHSLVLPMLELEQTNDGVMGPFLHYLTDDDDDDEENGDDATLSTFTRIVIDAFFDNDLFHTAKTFMANARGSFGISMNSSLAAHRQLVLASRGQTNSIAFFPKKGLVCFGSEQAAVKAGLSVDTPGGDLMCEPNNHGDKALRLDLNDLHGEICLLDWGPGGNSAAVSPPNRHVPCYSLMNDTIRVILYEESKAVQLPVELHRRMTLLEGHEFARTLPADYRDPVLQDLRDIPKVCRAIQDDWRGYSSDYGKTSLNRLTAWNYTKCLQRRLTEIHSKSVSERGPGSVDVLLTGCEVSLWLAEQFASDLTKAFPKLGVKAVSSNKILGLFGQDTTVPAIGFPMSQKTHDMKGCIVIIVSHSGGTFAPLACSNLLQSISDNIFCVTSEWDTQVAKQLRSMHDTERDHVVNSRIFTTECGIRPAEPCSISVAATQQLLTNIFEHTALVILSNPHFRHLSGAVITESDLQELERCNQENIGAMELIVGCDSDGNNLDKEMTRTERELRDAGDVWANHVLENVKAYVFAFLYIFGTVTSGYPLISGLARAAGTTSEGAFYITRFLDSAIYFWLPQILITIIRLIERRPLLHRMVGRTVVIGDCPWVSQCAEAFLSKIFATSYSIAGVNVLSGNPVDHLVHRHTHRVVRGSLLVCGRPDGRLSALTSYETSVCLSVNQASSIQSIGGTCESVTIGHNPFQLPLSRRAIFLDRSRPMFLCERILGEIDLVEEMEARRNLKATMERRESSRRKSSVNLTENLDAKSRQVKVKDRSAANLQGTYLNLAKEAGRGGQTAKAVVMEETTNEETVDDVIAEAIEERKRTANLRKIFNDMDTDGDGRLSANDFVAGYHRVDSTLNENQVRKIFEDADTNSTGFLTYDQFVQIAEMPELQMLRVIQTINRPRSLLQVEPSRETYFGESLRHDAPESMGVFSLEGSQRFSMELYESRVASLQRFVAMTIMFHQMGSRVENFFHKWSLGLLGYRFDRTHSIMRIATTASPVSGADVRERIHLLELTTKVKRSIEIISFSWQRYKHQKKVRPVSSGSGMMKSQSVSRRSIKTLKAA